MVVYFYWEKILVDGLVCVGVVGGELVNILRWSYGGAEVHSKFLQKFHISFFSQSLQVITKVSYQNIKLSNELSIMESVER